MQKTGAEPGQRAVAEILTQLASLYRGFVAWVSLYGDTDNRDEQDLRRERVARLLEELATGDPTARLTPGPHRARGGAVLCRLPLRLRRRLVDGVLLRRLLTGDH